MIVLYFRFIISFAVSNSLPNKDTVWLAPTLNGSVLALIEFVSIVAFPSLLLIANAQS